MSPASYEAAHTCRPATALLQKASVIACNLHDAAKARSHWKRMSRESRTQALEAYTRNGIPEATLAAS